MQTAWPAELLLIRHGESAGNVARERALESGSAIIDLDLRDCDVPLSELGQQQAAALGRWAARNDVRPDVVFASPYIRAQETALLALRAAQWPDIRILLDERLREKEFGILDRLTRAGIEQKYPDQAEMRRVVGKFYYRPPGGESWTDVILRLRNFTDTLLHQHDGKRVAIVSHQVIVLCFRYIVEHLTESQILTIDREGDVANCSVTTYRFDPGEGEKGDLRLVSYNVTAPLEEEGQPVTHAADVPVAPR